MSPYITTIHDLPDEMLEKILLHLDLEDRKAALEVCQRWSTLKPFDWSSVKLAIDFVVCEEESDLYYQSLLASNRRYRHLHYCYGDNKDSGKFGLFLDVLRHFNRTVESLDILMCVEDPVSLETFANIAALGSNLRHLEIGGCIFAHDGDALEIAPMPKLEELYLENNLISVTPNMKDITPNIKRLRMNDDNDFGETRRFLTEVSCNLVDLTIRFKSPDRFGIVKELEFSRLEKLQLMFINRSEPNEPRDLSEVDNFIRKLRGLLEVSLVIDGLTDRNIINLCQSCINLRYIRIRMPQFFEESFYAICELKHLTDLLIEFAVITLPYGPCPQLTSLRCLDLSRVSMMFEVELNQFIQSNFPNLTILKLEYMKCAFSEKFEMYRNLCSNITSLQRLELWEHEVNLSEFLEFCASCAPREVLFRCEKIMNTPPLEELPRIVAVHTLMLHVRNVTPIMLHDIINSMVELRRLEMMSIGDCTQDDIESLQNQFPRCIIHNKDDKY